MRQGRRGTDPARPPHASGPIHRGWLASQHPLGIAACLGSVLLATCLFLDPVLRDLTLALPAETRQGFAVLTRFGKGDLPILGSGLALALCLLAARHAPRRRQAILWQHGLAVSGFVLAVVVFSGVLVNVLKWGIGRARPSVPDLQGVFQADLLAPSADWASFPSGHATTAFALACALGFMMPRLRLLLLTVATWIALSRIIVGSHWASDAVAGAMLGVFSAALAREWFARRRWVFARRKGRRAARVDRLPALFRATLAALLVRLGLWAVSVAGRPFGPWVDRFLRAVR